MDGRRINTLQSGERRIQKKPPAHKSVATRSRSVRELSKQQADWRTPPNEAMLFHNMKRGVDRIDNVRALEAPLWSHNLRLAGRVDCVAEFDGKLSIIDFKGSTRKKNPTKITNYFCQATAYAIMWHEMMGESIDQIVILIIVRRWCKPNLCEASP